MIKQYVIVDNTRGVIGVTFNKESALEYINFLSDKYGQMVADDPNTYRFVWEDLESYSKSFLLNEVSWDVKA